MHKSYFFIALIGFFICNIIGVSAQTGNDFWFAAPDVSSNHADNGRPLLLHVTAVSQTHIIISRPADSDFLPIEFDLNAGQVEKIGLDSLIGISEVETYPMADLVEGIQDKGFHIQAYPGKVTVFYELGSFYNQEIFSLKGDKALGTEFTVSTQNMYNNGDFSSTAWSGFTIVATEDNTTVTVLQNDEWLYFSTPATRTILLNKGETFAFRAANTEASKHINGVKVLSDKDIAITIYDDSIELNGSYDIVGDQLVPEKHLGTQYLVNKSYLSSTDRIFITGTMDGTAIYKDGALLKTINTGDVEPVLMDNESVFIESSEPIYAFHIAGFGGEAGGAFIPPINEGFGNYEVYFRRPYNSFNSFRINLLARNDTLEGSLYKNAVDENFILVVGENEYNIHESYFSYTHDSAYIYLRTDTGINNFFTKRIRYGQPAHFKNKVSAFHLGILHGEAAYGTKYAYFSEFGMSSPRAGVGSKSGPSLGLICNLDPVRLEASGGNTYQWKAPYNSNLTKLLSDSTAAAPLFYPPGYGTYTFSVTIHSDIYTDTTITLEVTTQEQAKASFTIDAISSCVPMTVNFTNTTDYDVAHRSVWTFENPTEIIDQDTIPMSFQRSFPENTGSTVMTYPIRLTAYGPANSCPSIAFDTVKIFPSVKADFSVNDTIGCSPLSINIVNNSLGDIFYWNFGDGTATVELDPEHQYTNVTDTDTTYYLRLITLSSEGCSDTLIKAITVLPEGGISMEDTTFVGCSPLAVQIKSLGGEVFESLNWEIIYPDETSEVIQDSLLFKKQFVNNGISIDTIKVKLTSVNGTCTSEQENEVYVFPTPIAEFIPNDSNGCSPFFVKFDNRSQNASEFKWNLGNGLVSTDSLVNITYSNESEFDTTYTVILTASNESCSDTVSRQIEVYRKVESNLILDNSTGCAPMHVIIDAEHSVTVDSSFVWFYYPDNSSEVVMGHPFSKTFNNLNDESDTVNVELISLRKGCTSGDMKKIIVHPVSTLSTVQVNSDRTSGCSPLTVNFVAQSDDDVDYEWNFGNGKTATGQFAKVIYENYSSADKIFTTNLRVTDNYGCADTIIKETKVLATYLPRINIASQEACTPHETTISGSENDIIDSLLLFVFYPSHLDSVVISKDEEYIFNHLNTGAGTDTSFLNLYAFTKYEGCVAEVDTFLVSHPAVIADFDLAIPNDDDPRLIQLNNYSEYADSFYWDMGDGEVLNEINPEYLYDILNDTTFQISLLAKSEFCMDSVKLSYFVDVPETFLANYSSEMQAIEVYFNGAEKSLIIEGVNHKKEILGINIYSLDGKLVEKADIEGINFQKNTATLKLEYLRFEGFYIARINSTEGLTSKLFHFGR